MASANRPATDTTSTLSDSLAGWVSTLSVVNRRSMGLSSRRSLARPVEQGVRDGRVDRRRPALDQDPGRVDEGSRADGEVVDDQRGAPFHCADQLDHLGRLCVVNAPLVGDRGWPLQAVRPQPGLLRVSSVRGDHHEVVQVLLRDRVAQHGQRGQVVYWPGEETLHLRRVQVERDDPVGACGLDGVGAHAGTDRDPGLVFLVALGVAEVGDHGGNRVSACPFQRVNPEQQFHKVVVGGEGRSLDDEHVTAADVLEDLDEEISLGKPDHLGGAQCDPEIAGNGVAEVAARRAREHRYVRDVRCPHGLPASQRCIVGPLGKPWLFLSATPLPSAVRPYPTAPRCAYPR